ncbi:MAG: hypothetical protein IPM34_05650 [Saprospiraceae bacterium]|nr:hypothetical protein [Saprospiraceae bacterium]
MDKPGTDRRFFKNFSNIEPFSWKVILLLCLTVGMAPFSPEPHLWGKLKWIAGGANGMAWMDWFDFVFHGTPWLLLVIKTIHYLIKSKSQ